MTTHFLTTASIAPEVMKAFTADKLDLMALKGGSVRVRGCLRDFNGPSMDLPHMEQIEVL